MTEVWVSVPCSCVWADPLLPASPSDALAALPAEAERVRRAGARLIEFPAELCAVDPAYAGPTFWADAARVLDGEGLGATVHLPFLWADLAALDQSVWEGSVRSVRQALAATSPLLPQLAVVHPTSYVTEALVRQVPVERAAGLTMALAGRLVKALRVLVEEAIPGGERVGDRLALENLEGIPMDLFVRLVHMAGVRACLDVGHAISNGDDPLTTLRLLSSAGKLAGIHLHDAVPPPASDSEANRLPPPASGLVASSFLPPVGRAHLPLGEGRLDLTGLAAALSETRFEGPIVLEVEGDPYLALVRFLGRCRAADHLRTEAR